MSGSAAAAASPGPQLPSPSVSPPLPDRTAAREIGDLRRTMLHRQLRSYAEWVRDAIGWGCVVYFLIFLIAFLISGLDKVPHPDPPLQTDPFQMAILFFIALAFLFFLLPRRIVPVALSRQDLYRLTLSPLPARTVLGRSFIRTWLPAALTGLLLGGLWSFAAYRLFGLSIYTAGPALALGLAVVPSLRWLLWLRRDRLNTWLASRRWQVVGLVGCLAGVLFPSWGPAAPFFEPFPPGLVWYGLLAGGAIAETLLSLAERYPPSFAHQSFLHNRLRFLTRSRFVTGEMFDPAVYRRLLKQLRGRRIAARPWFVIPPFPRSWGDTGLMSWRTTLQLARRPFWSLLRIPGLALLGGLTAAFIQDDLFSIIYGTGIIGFLCADLLGPPLRPDHLPIRKLARTIGRVLPGLMIAALFTAAALLTGYFLISWASNVSGTPLPATSDFSLALFFRACTVLILGFVGLEKISVLNRQSHRRAQIFGPVGFLAILPSLILGFSGDPWAVGIFNLIAVGGLLILDR